MRRITSPAAALASETMVCSNTRPNRRQFHRTVHRAKNDGRPIRNMVVVVVSTMIAHASAGGVQLPQKRIIRATARTRALVVRERNNTAGTQMSSRSRNAYSLQSSHVVPLLTCFVISARKLLLSQKGNSFRPSYSVEDHRRRLGDRKEDDLINLVHDPLEQRYPQCASDTALGFRSGRRGRIYFLDIRHHLLW